MNRPTCRTPGSSATLALALSLLLVRVSSAAEGLSPPFQVNEDSVDTQFQPDVDVTPAGEFVVVWASGYEYAFEGSIQAQRFDAMGSPSGGQFQVSAEGTLRRDPRVAVDEPVGEVEE